MCVELTQREGRERAGRAGRHQAREVLINASSMHQRANLSPVTEQLSYDGAWCDMLLVQATISIHTTPTRRYAVGTDTR